MKNTIRRVALLSCLCASSTDLLGAGVTIITHGLEGEIEGWVVPMAQTILAGEAVCYEIRINKNAQGNYFLTRKRLGGPDFLASNYGEVVIKLDWSDFAGAFNLSTSTADIAAWFTPVLTADDTIPELKGHALAELPIHLIGHSRGPRNALSVNSVSISW